jgi:hypothetical protein
LSRNNTNNKGGTPTIKIFSGLPDDVLDFVASGKVTGKDYEVILVPAIE